MKSPPQSIIHVLKSDLTHNSQHVRLICSLEWNERVTGLLFQHFLESFFSFEFMVAAVVRLTEKNNSQPLLLFGERPYNSGHLRCPHAECDVSANHLWHSAGHLCTSCIYCADCTWSQQRHRHVALLRVGGCFLC